MSVRTDKVELYVNINGNDAQNQLNELKKKASDFTIALKGMKEGTQEYIQISEQLSQTETQIANLSKQLNITQLTMKELASTRRQLTAILNSKIPETDEWKKYAEQLQAVIARQKELKEQTQGFTETQQELKAEADASESSFAKLLQNVTKYFAAYLSFEKIKDFFQGVVDETNKADEASAQLFNTLENAGRTDLFETLSKQADDFAKSYKAIESTDVKSVFTKLIDYGKLTQAQITSLTDVIINYAQKQKISLPEATDIFTRALEGNTKELKTYGINMRDASTVTQRLQLLLGPLADKVSGAESAFEKTNSGALSTFKENIKRLQITIGEFAEDLVSMKDAADKANDSFDKAKAETDSYNQSLGPLLQRYDELKSKTNLNKSEHEELQGIIQQIVTILPSAASSFDQYGNAIDINRQKVDDFLQSNAKFLAQKEYAAVDEITQRVLRTVGEIKKQSDELSKHQITLFEGGGGTGGGGGQIVTRTSTLDEEKEQLAFLRTNQEQLLKDANTLSEKYGQTLPAGVQKAVETIKAEFDSIKDAQDKAQQYSKNWYNTQIKAFDDEIAQIKKGLNNLDVNSDAFKKESEVIKQLQKEEDDLKKQRDNVNKKIGNGNPDKLSKADADKYAALLKEAQDFYKQIQYLAQEDDAINQGEREKEIEDVKIKYQKLLDQANNYYKEHVTSLAQFKKEEAIIEKASDDEVAALRKKFKDEDDKVFTEQFAKKSDDEFKLAVKLSDQYYAEQKSAAAENYKDGLINQAEYDQQIYDIDQKALQARIVIANDYLKTSKDAADALADYTKQSADNTTKFLEQQAKAREDFNVKEVEAIVKQRQIEINDPSTPASTKAEAQRGNANDEAAAALKNLQDELQKQGKAFDIASASATEQGKAIWLEYAATMKQIDEDLLKTRIDNIAQYADYTKQALTSINTIITNAENKQLAKEQADNTAKQASLQKMLNNKLISQKQYDAQTQALTDDADAKSKKIQREQAKRQKALDLFQATIDVAEGIAAALKTPWLIPVIATLGALQIAAIASEPLPTAGRGKLLTQGPSHQERDKGLHVVNPRTGKTELLLEREEMVINKNATRSTKEHTITGTPIQIGSKLNSIYGGVSWAAGAVETKSEIPVWVTTPPPSINFNMPRIMAQGGIVPPLVPSSPVSPLQGAGSVDISPLTEQLMRSNDLAEKNNQINEEILFEAKKPKKNYVTLKDITDQQARLAAAQRQSGINTQ